MVVLLAEGRRGGPLADIKEGSPSVTRTRGVFCDRGEGDPREKKERRPTISKNSSNKISGGRAEKGGNDIRGRDWR